jgi:hypothetical protein
MLQIYKKHRGPSVDIKLARQALLASAGTQLGIGYF